ncbi:hypothetical protein GXB85_11280 [Cellulomonas sp. APG4]|uniref:hypothetical protein n=1 Tax=Cellulomonas sp. APG4 TaxID=1538656 RepID=UPI00137AEC8C|nr:hypothetical protein [Cellulomonas sp. APG4]NCT91529.1 hypothetical protein [Cellulomonas sp. APG4]
MSTSRRRWVLGAAGVAGAVGVAVAAGAVAPAVAAEEDDERLALREQRIVEALDELVEDGTIETDQAEAVAQTLAGSDALGPRAGGHMRGDAVGVDAAAEVLGLTTEELLTRLHDGDTLADVARDEGVEVDALVDALVAAARERLDDAVTDGRLTQAEADERAADLEDRIAERVEEGGALGRGPLGRSTGERGHGPHGPADWSGTGA